MSDNKQNEPVEVFGNWAVYPDGRIQENLPAGAERVAVGVMPRFLSDPDYLIELHAGEAIPKDEWYDFMGAFFAACAISGINEVTVNTSMQ